MKLEQLYRLVVLTGCLFVFAPMPILAEKTEGPATHAKINMAVADFTAVNSAQADASILAIILRTELINLGSFNIMDRGNMEAILAEQKFQSSGCTEQECAVQIGKLLNVQQIVVGSLSKLMDVYFITVNLVDVETGKIFASYSQEASSSQELKEACRILAQKIQTGGAVASASERGKPLPDTAKPEIPGHWTLGLVYPGAAIKFMRGNHAWELRGQSGSGIFAAGARYYGYFTKSAPRLYWGVEADFIRFKGEESRGAGFAGGGFLGGEIPIGDRLGLAMDFGPMYINLAESDYSQSASSMEYVLNMAIYWNFK